MLYQTKEGSCSVINSRQFNDIQKIMRDVDNEQNIMSGLRTQVSALARKLGMDKNHSENWSSVVAFIKGWAKGYQEGVEL